jgi:hypothetical protein
LFPVLFKVKAVFPLNVRVEAVTAPPLNDPDGFSRVTAFPPACILPREESVIPVIFTSVELILKVPPPILA